MGQTIPVGLHFRGPVAVPGSVLGSRRLAAADRAMIAKGILVSVED